MTPLGPTRGDGVGIEVTNDILRDRRFDATRDQADRVEGRLKLGEALEQAAEAEVAQGGQMGPEQLHGMAPQIAEGANAAKGVAEAMGANKKGM